MKKTSLGASTDRSAEVYRAAAKSIEQGSEMFSCIAIARQFPEYRGSGCYKFASKYINMFAKNEYALQIYFERGGNDARDYRILALCFMAAMVEAGDA